MVGAAFSITEPSAVAPGARVQDIEERGQAHLPDPELFRRKRQISDRKSFNQESALNSI